MEVMHNSPLKTLYDIHFQKSKQTILTRIFYVFVFYCGKASKHSYHELNQKYFMQLIEHISEAGKVTLTRNTTQWKSFLTLMHSKGRNHGLSFNLFLELLPEIGQKMAPEQINEDAFRVLVSNIMVVYEQRVAEHIQKRVAQYYDPLATETLELFSKLYSDLSTIYKIYWHAEYSHPYNEKINHQDVSFINLLQFMKDFEVFPKLISASNLYFIYNETIHFDSSEPQEKVQMQATKSLDNANYQSQMNSTLMRKSRGKIMRDIGRVFTLNKFMEILVAVSRVILPKLREVNDPEEWAGKQKQMLKIFLQYLEIARNKSKKGKFLDFRFTFIAPQNVPFDYLPRKEKKFVELFSNLKL